MLARDADGGSSQHWPEVPATQLIRATDRKDRRPLRSSPLTRGRGWGQANPQPSRRQGIIKASLVSAAQDESPSRRTCDDGGDFDCGGRLLGFHAGNQGHQLHQ
jgi:hypothetical protein